MSGRSGMGMGGYMMAPPSIMPPSLGNRWMGGVTGGMPHYPRREMPSEFFRKSLAMHMYMCVCVCVCVCVSEGCAFFKSSC